MPQFPFRCFHRALTGRQAVLGVVALLLSALPACDPPAPTAPPGPTTPSPSQRSLAQVDWEKTIQDIDCVDAGNTGIWLLGSTTAELRGNGIQDTVVWFECAHAASSWPSQVEVFDGSSDPAAPRQLGALLLATDEVNGRLIRVKDVTASAGRVRLDLAAYTEKDAMCCPSIDLTRTYAWNGSGFAQLP